METNKMLMFLFYWVTSFATVYLHLNYGKELRCSSVVEQWVVRSNADAEPHELFIISSSAPRLVQWPRYVLSCLWEGANKRCLAANLKEQPR